MITQRIIVGTPPVWDQCIAAFGRNTIVGKPVIFSWGRYIYNPTDCDISKALMAHEAVHGERQIADQDTNEAITRWWERYLHDKQFRLEEELLAHRAEYHACRKRHGPRPADLRMIAGRLASPLYGNLLTQETARHAILTGALPS